MPRNVQGQTPESTLRLRAFSPFLFLIVNVANTLYTLCIHSLLLCAFSLDGSPVLQRNATTRLTDCVVVRKCVPCARATLPLPAPSPSTFFDELLISLQRIHRPRIRFHISSTLLAHLARRHDATRRDATQRRNPTIARLFFVRFPRSHGCNWCASISIPWLYTHGYVHVGNEVSPRFVIQMAFSSYRSTRPRVDKFSHTDRGHRGVIMLSWKSRATTRRQKYRD